MQGRKLNNILLVLSSALFFAAILGWYGSTLPKLYESKTFLKFAPPLVSDKVILPLTEDELGQKLQPLTEEVLSRSTLEPMIAKYKLFETEKVDGMPIELIVNKMRKNIFVAPAKNTDNVSNGFSISYRDSTPEKAKNVTVELANYYVNSQNVSCCVCQSEMTPEYINARIKKAKKDIKKIERKRFNSTKGSSSDDLEFEYQLAKGDLESLENRLNGNYVESNPYQLSIRIVDSATLPNSPIFPMQAVMTGIGAFCGMMIGLMVLGIRRFFEVKSIGVAKIR
jgi:uncharacterized protein involved in exopolysaccharide biosynthesis